MDVTTNAINWFEIPVSEMDRAKKFYETVFEIQMETMEMMGMMMASFPYEPGSGKLSGALIKSQMHVPSSTGVIIYLNGNPDLDAPLNRVEAAGGKITMPKTKISDDIGFMAFFMDTEGNSVGLHSQN